VNVKILLFNNRIYGLTKGQYSPTSEKGKKTKSSPMGTLESPIRPLTFALGAGATFAARALANDVKHLEYVLERAAQHKGTALVEIYQNCVIFNDGAFDALNDKESKAENTVFLDQGRPLIYGKNLDKGIRLNGLQPEICSSSAPDLLVHNEFAPNATAAFMLSNMMQPDFPEPFGILRSVEADTLDDLSVDQVNTAKKQRQANLQALLEGGEAWTLN
jgi:2-oxoglutarate ferredoxin oxidoreductase subunit beta